MRIESEEIENQRIFEGIIKDREELLNKLSSNLSYKLNYSKYLPKLKKERREIYDDLKAWFKIPDHMNSACNILKTIDELYNIPEDEKTGLLAYIFDNYEILAFTRVDEMEKPKYSRLEVKRELKARKFKKLEQIDIEEGYYIGHEELGLYLPKAFNEQEKHSALYMYGLNCKIVSYNELLLNTI